MSSAPRSHWFESQGLRLHMLEWGDPDAPPLVLVHGSRDHAHSWDGLAQQLQAHWRVLAPDLRGHGDSDWVSDGVYSLDGYIFDLAQLIDIGTEGQVRIIAHSLGGRIALRYAGTFPERVERLIVLEGLGPPPDDLARVFSEPAAVRLRKWTEAYRDAVKRQPHGYASIDDAVARMAEQHPQLPAELVRHLTLTGTRRREDGSFIWKFDPRVRVPAALDMTPAELESIWRAIACPLLLIHGDSSFLPDPRVSHRERQFNNPTIAVIPGAGHWSHHDRPQDVLTLAGQFFGVTDNEAGD